MEAIGDITATCDVSRLQVDGPLFDSRIQGGVLADGLNGIIAGLCTITPMSTFAQNNGVIALTRCANRKAGYCCCFWLIIMGLFAKFAASLVAIPSSVLGGMTTCTCLIHFIIYRDEPVSKDVCCESYLLTISSSPLLRCRC